MEFISFAAIIGTLTVIVSLLAKVLGQPAQIRKNFKRKTRRKKSKKVDKKISKNYLSLAAQGIHWTKIGPSGVPSTSLPQKGWS